MTLMIDNLRSHTHYFTGLGGQESGLWLARHFLFKVSHEVLVRLSVMALIPSGLYKGWRIHFPPHAWLLATLKIYLQVYTHVVCRSPCSCTRSFLNDMIANCPRAGKKIRECPRQTNKHTKEQQQQKRSFYNPISKATSPTLAILYLLKADRSPGYMQGKGLYKVINARRWESVRTLSGTV